MKQKTKILIAGLAILLLGGAIVLVTRQPSLVTRRAASKATYYCPMHPTYTADRPGDCPICNMKLVKREAEPPSNQQSAISSQRKNQKPDICYMHNCPMVHQGKPCPMLVVAKEGERVTCPLCGTHVTSETRSPSRKILYWTDPMIPGYKADRPGKSPMGMDLIPVYEEAGAAGSMADAIAPEGYAPILVTPQKQQLIGVKTDLATKRTMTKTIRTVGRIAHDPQLYQAEAEYLQALDAWLRAQTATNPQIAAQAKQLVESARTRLALLGLSQGLIQEMTGWREPDKRLLLADLNGQVWLYAPIYEFELPLVQLGQTITAEIQAIPGRVFTGTIQSIDPVLDPATRSARVRAVLTDSDRLLKPEMFVNASVLVELGDVLAIPEEAVFDTGTKRIVFVDKGQGLFEPRDVLLGMNADDYYHVTRGVAEGELVVTSGNFLIDSESRLKAALEWISGSGLPAAPDQEKTGAAQAGEHQHGQTSP